jgi:hypothetical protein
MTACSVETSNFGLYGRMLHDGDRVLDLMSSWTSHLPSRLTLKDVTGLGLNSEELKKKRTIDPCGDPRPE